MEQKLNKFVNNFLTLSKTGQHGIKADPQIGFKVSFNKESKQLKVKVIGARQLPTDYGSAKARGYMIKVTVFPHKEKFETRSVKESWPTINEEFTFSINSSSKILDDYFKGKFVSLTVYAVMEEAEEEKTMKPKSMLKRFLSFNENDDFIRRNTRSIRRSCRYSMNNRRTIGAVTYNLERKSFTQILKEDVISTPDIWRSVKEITSGIQTQSREGKNGSVELTLQYAISEDRTNDVVEVSVTKYRCSLQTMHDQEKFGGQLYIKITAFETDDVIQKKKSDRFDPTISLKLESHTATLRATVNNYNLNQVKIVIRLLCKNILGKKFLLGKIEIDANSSLWKEIVATPMVPVTRMISFE